jgi:hypothetical protein
MNGLNGETRRQFFVEIEKSNLDRTYAYSMLALLLQGKFMLPLDRCGTVIIARNF